MWQVNWNVSVWRRKSDGGGDWRNLKRSSLKMRNFWRERKMTGSGAGSPSVVVASWEW